VDTAQVAGPFELFEGHEQVVFGADEPSGLRCIIAVHSTALGASLGGTRFYPYDTEHEALVDVLRLSRAMTYKAACAGLDQGGGKAVIIGDPETDKSEALLRAYARVIDSLGGRYITACDVGTYPEDMTVVQRETRWVTGMDTEHGGSGDSGITTAHGVHIALGAALIAGSRAHETAKTANLVIGVVLVLVALMGLIGAPGQVVAWARFFL
jgi:valine dehydrogenase (NAD+)